VVGPLDPRTSYDQPHVKLFLRDGREILGAIPRNASEINDTKDSSCRLTIEPSHKYDSVLNGKSYGTLKNMCCGLIEVLCSCTMPHW